MLAIIARFEFKDGAGADQWLAEAVKVVEPTHAEEGCNLYGFSKDGSNPKVVWVSEEWSSEETLAAHLNTPHVRGLIAATAGIEIVNADARKYQVSAVGPVAVPDA